VALTLATQCLGECPVEVKDAGSIGGLPCPDVSRSRRAGATRWANCGPRGPFRTMGTGVGFSLLSCQRDVPQSSGLTARASISEFNGNWFASATVTGFSKSSSGADMKSTRRDFIETSAAAGVLLASAGVQTLNAQQT
jgi:hypothetical protein